MRTDSTGVPPGPALLSVSHLKTRDRHVLDVSFTIHAGEILGMYGLAGAGRTELLEALSGLRPLAGGSVQRHAGQAPVQVLIPEDRRGQGLVSQMSVLENVTLSTLGRHARWGVLRSSRQRRATPSATETLQIRSTGPEQPVTELSGGNQQKVVFARALAEGPELWLCDEPTQAVDVMTRRAIHQLLRDQAAAGAGVIFVTSDLTELLQISSRALVLQAGRSVAPLSGDSLTQERVLQACYQPEDRPASGFRLPLLEPGPVLAVAPLTNAGSVHQWAANVFAAGDYQQLERLMNQVISTDLICLPYLAGERSPVQNLHARGIFLGVGPETGPGTVARAVLEGVAYALRATAEGQNEAPVGPLPLLGGGSRSAVWCQILADVFRTPVKVPARAALLPVLGAASTAFVYLGWTPSYAAYRSDILSDTSDAIFRLDSERADQHNRQVIRFQHLYPAVRDLF